MFFSRGKEQPPEATGSSSSSASTTTTGSGAPMVAQVDEAEWQTRGAAGLGAISSLSPECTPLKHRYDSCFNLWFKDYLAIGDDQIREQQRQGEASGSGTAHPSTSNNGKKRSSWFSDASSSSSGSTRASSIAESDVESSKRAIMERYDRDCGKLFNSYQACVRVSGICPDGGSLKSHVAGRQVLTRAAHALISLTLLPPSPQTRAGPAVESCHRKRARRSYSTSTPREPFSF